MTASNDPDPERTLILAPQGRDAEVARRLLAGAGLSALIVNNLSELLSALGEAAGAVLVTEEALRTADLAPISHWQTAQPAWSDMPFIILTRQGGGVERNPSAARFSETLGNVTFLERPFHPTTLVSVIRSALRGRRRQYEARDRLEALRASEERLRELNATLESRVARAVDERALAEAALRQSQKLEAVGQLTGGVAHDFNNMLTIIRSSVEYLRRSDLSESRRKRYTDAVSETVDRAAKLTRQLLAFARRQPLKPELFDVGERLRALTDMLDSVTGSRVRIVLQLPEQPCFVEADVSQFETAVVNLLVNARDAMGGEGTVTLRLESGLPMRQSRTPSGDARRFVRVSLSDTGTGIDPDKLERIFEPFFTTKAVGQGTGLGLSQVLGFLKQSGGDVFVESEVGKGSTFLLYLPQAEGSPAPKAEHAPYNGRGAGQNILIVEDNVEVGRFASQILSDLGYRTTWVASAEDALDRLRQGHAFDVVFSDVVMPGMGGLELAKRIRHEWPHLPILLTSGYSPVLAQEGVHGVELLDKPYSAEQLSECFRRML